MSCFTAAANSGQYLATGASRSSSPWSASWCAQSAVMPFVVDQTLVSVSFAHGVPRPGSAQPPHKSTTGCPRTITATAAPSSPRRRKFSSNAVRTGSNPGAQAPWISMPVTLYRSAGILGS
jgi:hypothetical protein